MDAEMQKRYQESKEGSTELHSVISQLEKLLSHDEGGIAVIRQLRGPIESLKTVVAKVEAERKYWMHQHDLMLSTASQEGGENRATLRTLLSHTLWPDDAGLSYSTVAPLIRSFGIYGNFSIDRHFSVPSEPVFAHVFSKPSTVPNDPLAGLMIMLKTVMPMPSSNPEDVFMELREMDVHLIPRLAKRPALLPFLVDRLATIIRNADHAELAYAVILYTRLSEHFADWNNLRLLVNSVLGGHDCLADFSIAKKTAILRLVRTAFSDPGVRALLERNEDHRLLELVDKNMNMPDILMATCGVPVVNRQGPYNSTKWLLQLKLSNYQTLTILNEDDRESIWYRNTDLAQFGKEVEYIRDGLRLASTGESRLLVSWTEWQHGFGVDVSTQADEPIARYLTTFYTAAIERAHGEFTSGRQGTLDEAEASGFGFD